MLTITFNIKLYCTQDFLWKTPDGYNQILQHSDFGLKHGMCEIMSCDKSSHFTDT